MGLAGRGHDVHMVAVDRPFRLPQETPVHFHPVTVADYPLFKHPPDDLCLANKLAEVTVEQDIQILHAHYAVPHTISAILAAQSVRPHPVRVVTTLHGTDITLVGSHRDFYRICRHAMVECDGLTAVSKWLCDRTMQEFDLPAEPQVIPNFVDCDRFSPGDRTSYQTPLKLLHVSNFRPVKRIFDVVRVFDQIRRHIDARLTLLGDGPMRGMAEEQVAELGLCDRVRFIRSQTDVGPLYRQHHLFLLLSEYESFGLSALEAMACGTPVLGTRSGGLVEVVEHGISGHLCRVGDIDELTECGLHMLEDPDRWARMSVAAAQRAKSHFCKDALMARYEAFYELVLAERPVR